MQSPIGAPLPAPWCLPAPTRLGCTQRWAWTNSTLWWKLILFVSSMKPHRLHLGLREGGGGG